MFGFMAGMPRKIAADKVSGVRLPQSRVSDNANAISYRQRLGLGIPGRRWRMASSFYAQKKPQRIKAGVKSAIAALGIR